MQQQLEELKSSKETQDHNSIENPVNPDAIQKLEKKIIQLQKEYNSIRNDHLGYQAQQDPLITSIINKINSLTDRLEENNTSQNNSSALNTNSELE